MSHSAIHKGPAEASPMSHPSLVAEAAAAAASSAFAGRALAAAERLPWAPAAPLPRLALAVLRVLLDSSGA